MMQGSSLFMLRQVVVPHVRRCGLRALSTTAAGTVGTASSSQFCFPAWLHLKAYAPYKQRMDTTDRIANSISKSGGYLTHSTLLSDMATTMVLEDVDPHQLQKFIDAIAKIEGLEFDTLSQEQLHKCIDMVNKVEEEVKEKAQHITTFQQSLRDIERDGLIDDDEQHKEFLQKCHEFANEMAIKNAQDSAHCPLPVTVHAILQLTWKDIPSKADALPFVDKTEELHPAHHHQPPSHKQSHNHQA